MWFAAVLHCRHYAELHHCLLIFHHRRRAAEPPLQQDLTPPVPSTLSSILAVQSSRRVTIEARRDVVDQLSSSNTDKAPQPLHSESNVAPSRRRRPWAAATTEHRCNYQRSPPPLPHRLHHHRYGPATSLWRGPALLGYIIFELVFHNTPLVADHCCHSWLSLFPRCRATGVGESPTFVPLAPAITQERESGCNKGGERRERVRKEMLWVGFGSNPTC